VGNLPARLRKRRREKEEGDDARKRRKERGEGTPLKSWNASALGRIHTT